ncbi:MAG TPA: histidine phosphatase family protein [Phycisphaerales bacterium]|nr:histidine phosphatase family protein [Phycisphaerales bacterium]HMP36374.1 histidine phosphatase family protein [Phycisphaerales bacterium]
MRVLVIRHAAAEERDARRWPHDSARPLTAQGIARFSRMLDAIRAGIPAIDRLLSSSYERAWATAAIVAELLDAPPPVRCDALEEQGPAALLDAVRVHAGEDRDEDAAEPPEMKHELGAHGPETPPDVMAIVGHEPYLSALVGSLAGAGELPRLRLRKGAIVALRLDRPIAPGGATIEWMVHPKLFGS